jgi:PAS domain S-box-containing protein
MKNQDSAKPSSLEEKSIVNELQLREILDKMIEGVQIIGFDWRHLYVNDAVVKQSHFAKHELLGYTMMERYPGIEQTTVFKILQECMDNRTLQHAEIDFEFPDKRRAWFELSIQPIREGIFILSIDITERREAQDSISRLNQVLEEEVRKRTAQLEVVNKDLEAFTYSVSHDLRAPLRSISGYSQILEDELKNDVSDQVKKSLVVIKRNTSKMNDLIDKLLEFSKLGTLELQKAMISSESLVHNCIAIIVSSSPYDKAEIIIKPLEKVYADHDMLALVWTNLIGNALKYSSKKEKPVVEIGSAAGDGETIFYVKDNGTGFDMHYADKLFQVFQRLHSYSDFEGTGVGLSIVKRIVAKHGGRVWAESKNGEGATFYFSIPNPL